MSKELRHHRKNCPALQAWDIPGACNCDYPRVPQTRTEAIAQAVLAERQAGHERLLRAVEECERIAEGLAVSGCGECVSAHRNIINAIRAYGARLREEGT
jgi:hypothetical protein